MPEETRPSPPPLPSLAPIGELLGGLMQLPRQLINDTAPEIEKQVKDIPDMIKVNGQFFIKQIREIPESIRGQGGDLMKSGFPVKTAAQAASPIPLLDKEDIKKIRQSVGLQPVE